MDEKLKKIDDNGNLLSNSHLTSSFLASTPSLLQPNAPPLPPPKK
jgi:hypothetical protein